MQWPAALMSALHAANPCDCMSVCYLLLTRHPLSRGLHVLVVRFRCNTLIQTLFLATTKATSAEALLEHRHTK